MKYEMIVDDQKVSDLIAIVSVDRTMGPVVKNRKITVNAYIINDVLQTIDVLNKLLTGDLQRFVFTDQPDRYWMGRVLGDIKPSSSERWAKVKIEIEVPDGVAYAIESKAVSVKGRDSVTLANEGSENCYPIFDFHTKAETYMVSAVGKEAVFQYGESLDASPLKDVTITRTKETGGYNARRNQLFVDDKWANVARHEYSVNKINSNWRTGGEFRKLGGTARVPTNGKVTVADWATRWQTGERIADWVKGKTFKVAKTRNVKQSKSNKAYLLVNQGQYLGWLLEQDIAGGVTPTNTDDIKAYFGNSQGNVWAGPAMRYHLDGRCTDFSTHTWFNFVISDPRQTGAFYFAVMREDTIIASILLSSHQNNLNTYLSFNARGKTLDLGAYDKRFTSNFWGSVRISKRGNVFTFEVLRDDGQKIVRTYTVPGEDIAPSHVLVWAGRYGNRSRPSEISAVSLNFSGTNTEVYVDKKTETIEDVKQLPDPQTIIPAGATVRLDMSTNFAYLNGQESLTPIQYGSKAVAIPPGTHEVKLVCDAAVQPTVDIYYREVYR